MSDIIREALEGALLTNTEHRRLATEAALAELDRRDAQDILDQEHLTRVVAERAAAEERYEALKNAGDNWPDLARLCERMEAAEERSRQLAEALSHSEHLLARASAVLPGDLLISQEIVAHFAASPSRDSAERPSDLTDKETWDCGCPFEGPHNEECALAAAAVSPENADEETTDAS